MEENTGMNPVTAETAIADSAAVPEESAAAQDSGTAAETGGASPERDMDDGPILPDGWTPEEDILSGPSLKDLFPDQTGAGERNEETGRDAAQTPKTEAGAEAGKDTAPAQEAPENGGEPDYRALYEALVQQGKDAEDKATFRRVYQEELDAGMSDRWARTAAAQAVGGRTFPLTDEPGGGGGAADSGPDATAAAVKQLNTLYPGLKEIPAEVGRMVKDGVDLVSAYGAYRTREDAKTIQNLTAENQRLMKILGNTAKAPVQGVSGGGKHQEETDPFLQGFNRFFQD